MTRSQLWLVTNVGKYSTKNWALNFHSDYYSKFLYMQPLCTLCHILIPSFMFFWL